MEARRTYPISRQAVFERLAEPDAYVKVLFFAMDRLSKTPCPFHVDSCQPGRHVHATVDVVSSDILELEAFFDDITEDTSAVRLVLTLPNDVADSAPSSHVDVHGTLAGVLDAIDLALQPSPPNLHV